MRVFNLTENLELAFWFAPREPGLGITTTLCGPVWTVSVTFLVVGVALTRWGH